MTATRSLSETSSRGIWLTVLAAFLFGVNGAVAGDLVSVLEPGNVAQIRAVLAALILGLLAYQRKMVSTGGRLLALIGFGVNLAVVSLAFFIAIERLGVGPGVTIQFSGPVLVLIWLRLVEKRHVPPMAWTAAVVALVGVGLVSQAWRAVDLDPVGLTAAGVAALSFAIYIILSGWLGRRLPALTTAAYGFAFSALILLAVFPIELPPAHPKMLAELAYLVALGTVAPFLLEVEALRIADPASVGVAATLEPVVAAAAAWFFLGQGLGELQIVGAGLVVGAVALIQRFSARPPLGV